jgi:hypothetical protein
MPLWYSVSSVVNSLPIDPLLVPITAMTAIA